MTRTEALANLAEQNVVTTARLVDDLVLTEDDLRDAKRERTEAYAHLFVERVALAS